MSSSRGDISDVEALAEAVRSSESKEGEPVGEISQRVVQQKETLAPYGSADELGAAALDNPDSPEGRLADEIAALRNGIAGELNAAAIFVGPDVLDGLLFHEIAAGKDDPIVATLERLRDAEVDRAGFLLFALHSFGIAGLGPRPMVSDEQVRFDWSEAGIAITPQTNSFDLTLEFVDHVVSQFQVTGVAPRELLRHFRRSRPTAWLEKNPLIAVSVSHVSGHYFTNESMLLSRIQEATSLVAMQAASQGNSPTARSRLFSTARMNNQETLDIHHYFVFSPAATAEDEIYCDVVPISGVRPDIVEVSELPVELDLSLEWDDVRSNDLRSAVDAVYEGYLRHALDGSRDDDEARAYRKAFGSLAYFKRSFSERDWQAIIALAVAFEMVLIKDSGSKNVAKKVRKRITGAFPGSSGKEFAAAFSGLYQARSEIVHAGKQRTHVDLPTAQRAFVECFKQIAMSLSSGAVPARGELMELLPAGSA